MAQKKRFVMQENVPVNAEAFDFFTFFSGYGFWLLLAIILVVLVIYKKTKK